MHLTQALAVATLLLVTNSPHASGARQDPSGLFDAGHDGDEGGASLELRNDVEEVGVHFVASESLGVTGLCEVTDTKGDRLVGYFRDRIVLPISPQTTRHLRVVPVALEEEREGFSVTLITPSEDRTSAMIDHVDANVADLGARIEMTLSRGGVVIANHRGQRVLTPLPDALGAILRPRIFPYRPASVWAPKQPHEERRLLGSAAVEWELGYPAQPLTSDDAFFVCEDSGIFATPLRGATADGMPAARAFAIHMNPGLVLVTMDLSARAIDSLAPPLRDAATRFAAIRATGRAAAKVRATVKPGGRFEGLNLDRIPNIDLIPADPQLFDHWAAGLPNPRLASVRTFRVDDGPPLTEEVLQFHGSFLFALGVPPNLRGDVVFVVRRAPTPIPTSYNVTIDAEPIGPPVTPTSQEDSGAWVDDVFRLSAEQVSGRPRVAMAVTTEGGPVAIARIGIFLYDPPDGIPLGSRIAHVNAGDAPVTDRSFAGTTLQIGDRSYLSGLGLASGMSFEYRLDGGFLSLLARVGIDHSAGDRGSAIFVVDVDGVERYRSQTLVGGGEAEAVTVPLLGSKRLTLRVEDAGDGADFDFVSLIEPRLIRD